MTHTATATPTCAKRGGRWNPINIVLMILGFIIFWPLGLAMLAWIIWGDEIGRTARDFKARFHSATGDLPAFKTNSGGFGRTGNLAFDEYRDEELKRLDEERRKLDRMRAEFEGFLTELRRVKDQDEFNRFKSAYEKKVEADAEADDTAKKAQTKTRGGKSKS